MTTGERLFLIRLRNDARKTRVLANHLRDRLILRDRPMTQIALLGKQWRAGTDVLDAMVHAGIVVVSHRGSTRFYSLASEVR